MKHRRTIVSVCLFYSLTTGVSALLRQPLMENEGIPFAPTALKSVPVAPSSSLLYVTAFNESWSVDAAEFNGAPYLGPHGTGKPTCSIVAFAYNEAAVVKAVRHAPSKIQVRSGRHSYLAFAAATEKDEITTVIDVSNLTHIGTVRLVRLATKGPTSASQETEAAFVVNVGPGVRLFDLYDKLASQGYMFPGGSCPTVGSSGFVLGGGYGFWSKKYGLGAQNLVGAHVVTATGSVEKVSLVSPATLSQAQWDLLWALRGAGTNSLGAVTQMTLQVYPLPSRGTSWVDYSFPNQTSCVIALERFQLNHQPDTEEIDAASQPPDSTITYQMNIYTDRNCRVSAVGLNLSAIELLNKTSDWLTVPGAITTQGYPLSFSGTAEGWLGMIRAAGGCGTLAQCRHTTRTEYPNPQQPLRWGAMSSYLFTPVNATRKTGLLASIGNVPRDYTGFSVVMLDGYGGEIRRRGRGTKYFNSSSFPSTDALFHFQILSYFYPGAINATNSRNWQLGVFNTIDFSQSIHRSYRNYPSPLFDQATTLPKLSAVERYYGPENLVTLRRLTSSWDPTGKFNYSQGV